MFIFNVHFLNFWDLGAQFKILQFLGMKSVFNHSANHLYQKFMTFGSKNTSMMIGIVKEVLTIEIFAIVLIKRNVKIITNETVFSRVKDHFVFQRYL